MQTLEKNHFPASKIAAERHAVTLRRAALPMHWFLLMAVFLAVAAAAPLAVLAAGS